MLQYKVSDLVKQAKSKADLQNSDFITHSDDISLINDIWLDLYQNAINAGEKFYLKSVSVEEDVIELPSDFFQLYALRNSRGFEIPRRTASEISSGYRGYEIKNNKLYLYNVREPVTMDYFPVPATLTYPFKAKPYSFSETFYSGYGKKVYSATSVFDLETNEVTQFATEENLHFYQVYADYIIVYVPGTGNKRTFYFYDVQTLELVKTITDTVYYPVQDTVGKTYLLDYTNKKSYDLDMSLVETDLICSGDASDNMVVLDDGRVAVLDGYSSFWNREGNLYYTDSFKVINILYPDENTTINAGFQQRGVLLEDDPISGNGIWFHNTLYSASEDTVLNYPNNLFYSVIAYKLAVHYKIKQNEDATNLSALADEAYFSYFDSVSQDDNEPVRIKNVY